MSLDSCFGREISILDDELAKSPSENIARELELEAGDYERDQIRRHDL